MWSGFGHSGEPRRDGNDDDLESIGSIDLTGDGLVGLGGSRGVGVACLWPRMAVESAIRELSEWLRCKAYFFFSGFGRGPSIGARTADHGGREGASGEGSDGRPAGSHDGGALQKHSDGNWGGREERFVVVTSGLGEERGICRWPDLMV